MSRLVPTNKRSLCRLLFMQARVMTQWYFVWVEGLRGPAPQKWCSDALWGQLGRQDVIVRFALTEQEAELSLDELAKRHPVPGE
jgi:hypothetical protein